MEKNYVFYHKTDLEHYTADAFTVRCVDDRFWKAFKYFLRAENITRIDPKSPAGGAKIFSSPEKEGDRDFMLREIDISIKLHGVKRAMLFTHHDCGAYGGFKHFGENPEEEYQFHVTEHHKAREVIRDRFPDLRVETYFIDEKGVIHTS
ncbi:MAG: hypothetical protein A2131_00595 [Candidatus Sungbacteria bacterium GWC2_49_10]|uniref:Carbonic anhydrase n=2 Tax=Parcubacteria group TaxID=1794811 RepID=A0A0G1Z1R6_9BACT|nr:MAG: hypothetical protein UY61_C0010G0016 [Candidatus Adlerbacteria bacterium GW2011_GWC1_50_9]OGZ93031.1 MAG: hypothetical protein A2131_00595 [Candidatus Sungbacteria bacterium GWC2_49_10]